MTDTKPQISRMMTDMMMRKSGVERLRMGLSMFDMAKRLVIASLPASSNNSETRKLLFLRFYQDCLDHATMGRILKKL